MCVLNYANFLFIYDYTCITPGFIYLVLLSAKKEIIQDIKMGICMLGIPFDFNCKKNHEICKSHISLTKFFLVSSGFQDCFPKDQKKNTPIF